MVKSLIRQIRQFLHEEAKKPIRGFIFIIIKIHNHNSQSGIGQTHTAVYMSTLI